MTHLEAEKCYVNFQLMIYEYVAQEDDVCGIRKLRALWWTGISFFVYFFHIWFALRNQEIVSVQHFRTSLDINGNIMYSINVLCLRLRLTSSLEEKTIEICRKKN